MPTIREKLAERIPRFRDEIKQMLVDHGDKVVSEVTMRQVYGGMRGVKGLFCNTSSVDPEEGLIIRGEPILDLSERLPEEIVFLLISGEFPDEEGLNDLQKEMVERRDVPSYVWDVLNAMPKDSHPMCMFNTAILSMQRESVFAKKYEEGIGKNEYWEPMLEDFLNIWARLPGIAAYIYRLRFNKGERINHDPNLDWAADFAQMLGLDDSNGEFTKLMRLYMVLHTDHEGGNVSAFTAHTVSSALSDPYYSLSAGLNGLAGPLHGLANQECLKWVLELVEEFGGVPEEKRLEEYTWETLNSGRVIPGYGHAVLRVTDPRFTAFHAFGKEYCMNDPVFQTVDRVFNVVPKVLKQIEKISNPWPNVDAASGSLLHHYGLKEFSYYTVLFSVSRSLGIGAQNILARGFGLPIVRPKSVTLEWMRDFLAK
ncbi:MAG: citrate (Si)-synthase [Candidatus Hinthialibacter antarcticus]|nr:citrate (Si)-synthase [Candidatus Hinthialibacter antarcticus]